MSFLLGKKLKMTQIFQGKKALPVTLIAAGPCKVTQVKIEQSDGYNAVQIGFQKKKPKHTKKTEKGKPFRYLREFRLSGGKAAAFKEGQKLDVSAFKEGAKVTVSGKSKGKGFQGVVKRWGFSGFGASHGIKHGERAPGSIGSAYPQRVLKGKKMAGHMGARRTTVKNLEVVKADKDRNLLALKGAVPGHRGTLLSIKTN